MPPVTVTGMAVPTSLLANSAVRPSTETRWLRSSSGVSPAKVIAVLADPEDKTAKVVVPDYQLSLAIGKEGQNARLAARLTGFKIDIKSETQAREIEGWLDVDEEYEDFEDYKEAQALEEAEAGETAEAEEESQNE